MFFSHTFLAKKSPLGTVWIAAHLQHKLRKSHIAVTDISSTVDCIIFPEVPIALRLSGHLLLGVVRIYSKKVDYLFHECNDVLSQMRTMFAAVHVNLPADADRATFQAVTLPDTFELDALELDPLYEDSLDHHLKTSEQITLPDQIPVDGDPYVAFIISEERFDSSPQPVSRSTSSEPMVENVHAGSPQSVDLDLPAHSISPIEVARNAAADLDFAPESIDLETAILDRYESGGMMKEGARVSSPAAELLPVSREDSLSLQFRAISPALPSLDASSAPSAGHSPDLELEPSPPAKRGKKKARKRKQLFDAVLVMSNRDMKRQLDDASAILRKRQRLSSLKNTPKEDIFNLPLLPGMCIKLQEAWERAIPELVNADDMDMEIERARDAGAHPEPMLSREGESTPPPVEREEPSSVHLSRPSEPMTVITPEPLEPASYEHYELGAEMADSPEELTFLEAESTASGDGTAEVGSMSTRTRLVANFFKEQSPSSRSTRKRSGQLNLSTILQGKTRKQCARMFFETLVLKNCDLVEVKQEQAYADVWISLKPTLSKLTF